MRSPSQAILWEIWARNRPALIGAFGLMPLCVLLGALAAQVAPFCLWLARHNGWPPPNIEPTPFPVAIAAFITVISAMLSLACIFWAFSFTSVDERGRFAGFPARMFTLPVVMRRAVTVPVVTGIAAVLLAYSAWWLLVRKLIPPSEVSGFTGIIFAWQLLIVATCFVAAQAVIWLMYPFRFARMWVLTGVATASFWMWVWVPSADFFGHPQRCFALAATVFAMSCAGAFAVVEWDRRGGWQGVARWSRPLRKRVKMFGSAARAQFWLEWRRKGFIGTAIIGVGMALSLLVWPVPHIADLGHEPGEFGGKFQLFIFWLLLINACIFAATMGGAFGKSDAWVPELEMHSFQATRPVTTAELVFAKMRSVARMIVGSWCVLALMVGYIVARCFVNPSPDSQHWTKFWINFPTAHDVLLHWLRNPFVLFTLIALHWHAVVQTMSLVLSGQKRRLTIGVWIGALSSGALLGAAVWSLGHPWYFEWWRPVLPWLAAALAVWKAACAAFVFRQARRGLLSPNQFRILLALWLTLVCGLIFSAAFAARLGVMPVELIWFLAAWFMPAAEIPSCVTNLALNRHR